VLIVKTKILKAE
jgi:hypothetical protein